MYDGVHIRVCILYGLYKSLLQEQGLVVKGKDGEVFYAEDGESTHMYITRKYSRWYGEFVELHGSIHKFYTGGNNTTTFTFSEALIALQHLKEKFLLSWENHITRLEVGINIKVDDPVAAVHDAILYGNKIGKNENEDYEHNEHYVTWMFKEKKKDDVPEGVGCLGHDVGKGYQVLEDWVENKGYKQKKRGERKNHCLKLYVKTADAVRFEDKVYRLDRRFKFIKTLGDLTQIENLIKCQNILLEAMGKIVFIPLSFAKSLPPEESKKWLLKRELSEWESLRLSSKPYVLGREKQRLYKDLVKQGGKDWRQLLLAGMRTEVERMLESAEIAIKSLHGLLRENDAGATSACVESEVPDEETVRMGDKTSFPQQDTSVIDTGEVEGCSPGPASLQSSSTGITHTPTAAPSARGPPPLVGCISLLASTNGPLAVYPPSSRRGGEARRRGNKTK